MQDYVIADKRAYAGSDHLFRRLCRSAGELSIPDSAAPHILQHSRILTTAWTPSCGVNAVPKGIEVMPQAAPSRAITPERHNVGGSFGPQGPGSPQENRVQKPVRRFSSRFPATIPTIHFHLTCNLPISIYPIDHSFEK